ncbi:hypothetical protein GCM10009868_01460 [Terrabacter aerolatus]|uniref:Lipoprotein LpqN n=1 Tax=Terrabacter aerolatus TaxID=422442 RepID=A0A512D5P7_9MICO|nr:hypothetical protein [Terrabacter aerolatus]GEO31793.1 hypothetical protein TAE01_36030 [Terrabacter aerolatus]
MTTLAYPSADFPGQPSVALEVPDGWEPAHAPGTTLAARLPRDGGFAPNVVVTIEPCGPGFQVSDSLDQIASLATSNAGTVSEPYAADLGGAQFVGCDATWPDAHDDTVLQANLFHLVASDTPGAGAHLVQLTGAVGGPDALADYELIRQVLTTVRVTPWSQA